MRKSLLITAFVCSLPLHGLQAQTDSTAAQRITLKDGSELVGNIVRQDADSVTFVTTSGIRVSFSRKTIKEMQKAKAAWDGNDPNQTRLFFSPTGHSLEQGKGYFAAYEIFFPMLAVGVTDFLTLAGGVTLFPGATEQAVYLAPKVRVAHFENVDLSGGVLYIRVSGYTAGMAYGVTTIGTSKASLTGGLAWGFVEGDFSGTPTLMLGGEYQVSGSTKFITENWFPAKSDVAIISFGIRFFGENLAGDFGLMRTTASQGSGFPFLPWIGFAYNF
jgi:hypothetical protein